MSALKTIQKILPSPPMHWVGDGFPVSTVISPQAGYATFTPFIMMDYAGPAEFGPSKRARGVDSHPHKGFETVTVVYRGELEHRDSGGNSGKIGPGDVQWMTAGSGVLHEEKHSGEFTRRGGTMEMAQLWVNLRAADKSTPPGYQTLLRADIPTVELPGGAGNVRVIAGDFALPGGASPAAGVARGAARTFSPVILWDVRLNPGAEVELPAPEGFTFSVFVRTGAVDLGTGLVADQRQLAVFSTTGSGVRLRAPAGCELLVLGGEPIREAMSSYGPFVMNTPEEIKEAIEDFRAGRMGELVS